MQTDIGKKIRARREELGMTQEELAHKVGYKSRVSINKIELQRDLPINKIVPIAKALGVEPGVLMGWEDDSTSREDSASAISEEDNLLIQEILNADEKTKKMIIQLLAFAKDQEK